MHGRDKELLARLRRGEALKLVGGGHFLQQPIFARDLAKLCLSCAERTATYGKIFQAAGPDMIESREYYRIVAEALGVGMTVEELPVGVFRAANPGNEAFLCHRIYDLAPLREAGLVVPATPVVAGLREQVQALVAAGR